MPGLGEFPGRLEGNDRWPKKCSPAKPAGFPKKAHREISGSLIFRKNLIIPYATLRSMRKRMCPPIQLPALRGIFLCRLPPPPGPRVWWPPVMEEEACARYRPEVRERRRGNRYRGWICSANTRSWEEEDRPENSLAEGHDGCYRCCGTRRCVPRPHLIRTVRASSTGFLVFPSLERPSHSRPPEGVPAADGKLPLRGGGSHDRYLVLRQSGEQYGC